MDTESGISDVVFVDFNFAPMLGVDWIPSSANGAVLLRRRLLQTDGALPPRGAAWCTARLTEIVVLDFKA